MIRTDRRLGGYRILVVAAAAAFLAVLSCQPWAWGRSWAPEATVPFFVALALISEGWPLILPRYGAFSLADAVTYAVMVLFGPLMTVLTGVVAGLSRFRRESRSQAIQPDFVAYSLSQSILSYGIAASIYQCGARPEFGVTQALLLSFCVTVAFLMQSFLVSVHQWLEQGRVGVWTSRVNWQRLRLAQQALMPLGVLMAVTAQLQPVALLFLLGPLAVTYLSIRNYTETLREAREIIEYLAQAVERREPIVAGHTTRVAAYAADIARQLRLPEPVVGRVATAARLHDLGKISVDDKILCKAGRLEPQEWEQVRRYPEIGAQVASRLSLCQEEAEYIRYHQEWFNGGGYPYGLRGQQIPVGARILAVAKAFDAMTSPRSYRKAVAPARAVRKLFQARGTQFDPLVVEALIEVLGTRRGPVLAQA